MNAAGARALLSAKCPSYRRLLARAPAASAVRGSQRRSFRASAPVRSRADEPPATTEEKNANNHQTSSSSPPPPSADAKGAPAPPPAENTTAPPAKEDANSFEPPKSTTSPEPPKPAPETTTTTTTAPPASTVTPTTHKGSLRSQGYGSARARANRPRTEDRVPPFTLPESFLKEHVSLYEARLTEPWVGGVLTGLPPLSLEDREAVLDVLAAEFDKAALTPWDVQRTVKSSDGEKMVVEVEGLVEKVKGMHAAAYWAVLAVAHRGEKEERVFSEAMKNALDNLGMDVDVEKMITVVRPDGSGMVGKLKGHWEERGGEEFVRWLWRVDGGEKLSAEAQKWLAGARVDGKLEALDASPLARRPEAEYAACVELLAAVRAELTAESPGSRLRELQRPVTILSMLNCKGMSAAKSVVDEVATEVEADVVHFNAVELASILGSHLGQNLHWSRGSISMLGYAAAEMNGRSVSRADVDGEAEVGIHVTLPPRLRSFFSTKESSAVGGFDGRWEELKMMQALESLVGAADVKRGKAQSDRPLIVHVHDFVEISELHEGIIIKLRHIVDRMWQAGRKVVMVGSSGSDVNRSGQWRDQLVDLGRDGSHIIPFQAAESRLTTLLMKQDNYDENLLNISNMLRAMLGPSTEINFTKTTMLGRTARYGATTTTTEGALWQNVYDVQWVYRLASLMIGSRTPPLKTFTIEDLRYGLSVMSDRNKQWTTLNPAVRPPYFSPLFTPRSSMPGFTSSPEEWSPDNMMGQGPSSSGSKDYDQHEKKLLSGLINAKDIHTTFNDIIVPPETKESLIGLTSLSLVRPDAFSYGVLKTERIPGCLLYGPPGTGKTLLAKAVAKESGANMLEVSAASINDMWLGQSEKNVRALFSLARKMAPMVIFLDEADALLGARHNAPGRNAHRETITQFLREWDGLSDMRAFIMVATNRPFDLDEAVLRRLPRKILVDLPLTKEREGILRVMLREESLAEDVDLAKLAVETELYSGSDLKNLCVSAAMEAVREEVRHKEAWKGEGEYVFPEKRILTRAHFDKGMREISASISEDMESLKAIRKFDAQYGDAGRKRRGRKAMGFEVVPEKKGTEEARVRQVAV